MDDYISREAVLKRFEQLKDQTESLRNKLYLDGVAAVIDTLPAADVAPVVRCKDCIYGESDGVLDGYRWCSRFDNIVGENDFCSFGKIIRCFIKC